MKRFYLTLALAAAPLLTSVPASAAQDDEVTFNLTPNPKFLNCLRGAEPGDPKATVKVVRGKLNDSLNLRLSNFKPNLAFDLFTVQRSSLLSDGSPDVNFKNFGMAWYQSDVQVNLGGSGEVSIRTILLDQIFGFDPDVALAPTNTFHVGFWFNNPQDAAACGFDVTKPTPFNGEHKAGPLAMISVPNPTTGLGPLCTDPNFSTHPTSCNP
jgi:hypothetical protein